MASVRRLGLRAHDGVDVRAPSPCPSNPQPAPQPVLNVNGAEENIETESRTTLGFEVIAILCAAVAAGAFTLLALRNKAKKKKGNDLSTESKLNSHVSGYGKDKEHSSNTKRRIWTRRNSTMMEDFRRLDIGVEVRNSAQGGWQGVYVDEQLHKTIDIDVPSTANGGGDEDGVVEDFLFTVDGLKAIEYGLDNYEMGDMDDVCDEDLIRAYNEAMALDMEPDDEDVEFDMAGTGSDTIVTG